MVLILGPHLIYAKTIMNIIIPHFTDDYYKQVFAL